MRDLLPLKEAGPQRDWFSTLTIVIGVLAGLVMIAAVIRALLVPPVMATLAESFTTTRAAWTPPSPLTEPEREALEETVDTFVESVRDDGVSEPTSIMLTADDLNALLEDAWKDSDGEWKLSLNLVNGVVTGLLSVRIDRETATGMWAPFAGRYVNANCTLDLRLEGGQLRIDIAQCLVQGRSVPRFVVNDLNDRLREAIDDDTRRFFANLTAFEVLDDRIVLTAVPETPPGL